MTMEDSRLGRLLAASIPSGLAAERLEPEEIVHFARVQHPALAPSAAPAPALVSFFYSLPLATGQTKPVYI